MLDTAEKIFEANPNIFREVAKETYTYEEFIMILVEFSELLYIKYLPSKEKKKLYEYAKN